MPIQAAFENLVAADASAHVTHLSLHSTNGGATGAGELTGGSYARQTPTYVAGATGVRDLSAPVTFGGPAASTAASFLGFWAGTTWLGSEVIPSPPTLTSADTLEIASAPIEV